MPFPTEQPSLRQSLLKTHETRSAVAAILERLPDLQGLDVRAAEGAVPFSAERLGGSLARAMKEAGEHDDAALAYVTYRVFVALRPLVGAPPVAPQAIADAAGAALLASGLHASLDAYLHRDAPKEVPMQAGASFDVSLPLEASALEPEQQRVAASLTQWAKADHFFAGEDDLARFERALSALLGHRIVAWDGRTWARLVGGSAMIDSDAARSQVIGVPPEFVHALGEGRPGMLLDRMVSAIAESGALLQFDGADKRWNSIPYVWQSARRAVAHLPASFAAVDLAALLEREGGLDLLPAAAETLLVAQDILLSRLQYRDLVARRHAEEFRPLAVGLVGFSAALAHHGVAADHPDAPALCAALAAVFSGSLHAASARLASARGQLACWKLNERPALRVVGLRRDQALALPREGVAAALSETARTLWEAAFANAVTHGLRHSQLMALVPEPPLSRLADGQAIDGVRIPDLATVSQLALMVAAQPFVSGPAGRSAVVSRRARDIGDAVLQAARGGLVSVRLLPEAPASAPIPAPERQEESVISAPAPAPAPASAAPARPAPASSPSGARERPAVIHAFTVGGAMATLTVAIGEQGRPAGISLSLHKPGSTAHGLCAVFSEATTLALEAGVPLAILSDRFTDVGFAPYGPTDNPDIATSASIVDYAFRWLARRFPEPSA